MLCELHRLRVEYKIKFNMLMVKAPNSLGPPLFVYLLKNFEFSRHESNDS